MALFNENKEGVQIVYRVTQSLKKTKGRKLPVYKTLFFIMRILRPSGINTRAT